MGIPIYKPNVYLDGQGDLKSRNRALAAAAVDYLTYVDSNDWSLPRKLELDSARQMGSPACLVYSAVRIIDAGEEPIDSGGQGDDMPKGEVYERFSDGVFASAG